MTEEQFNSVLDSLEKAEKSFRKTLDIILKGNSKNWEKLALKEMKIFQKHIDDVTSDGFYPVRIHTGMTAETEMIFLDYPVSIKKEPVYWNCDQCADFLYEQIAERKEK